MTTKKDKEKIEKKVQAEVQKEVKEVKKEAKKEVLEVKKEAEKKVQVLEEKKDNLTDLIIKILNRKDWSLIISIISLILNISCWALCFYFMFTK